MQSIFESSFFPNHSYIQCRTPGHAFELTVITITFHPRWKTAACAFHAWPWGNGRWSWAKSLKFGPRLCSKRCHFGVIFVPREDIGWIKSHACPPTSASLKALRPWYKLWDVLSLSFGGSLVFLRRDELQAMVVLRELQCLAGQNVCNKSCLWH